jgi:hypothetical protein
LRRLVPGDVAERLPHVHHDELDFAALVGPARQKLRHAGLRAILAAEPDGPLAHQVAHHVAIAVALADRDFVDPDRRRSDVPARLSWARMYCISSVVTVSQSSFSSVATSRRGLGLLQRNLLGYRPSKS